MFNPIKKKVSFTLYDISDQDDIMEISYYYCHQNRRPINRFDLFRDLVLKLTIPHFHNRNKNLNSDRELKTPSQFNTWKLKRI